MLTVLTQKPALLSDNARECKRMIPDAAVGFEGRYESSGAKLKLLQNGNTNR
jgi:hypothetical protein